MKSYIVDSFTTQPFRGNPAAVCFPEHPLSNETMQKIAAEFGLSETAFVQATATANLYNIRYFSPKKEIPLCGHATLAAAKVIFSNTAEAEIHFITGEKLDLLIKRNADQVVMEFPVYDTVAATVPEEMLVALGIAETTNIEFSNKNKIFLLEIKDAGLLANLRPDFDVLIKTYDDINGVLVTAPSNNSEYDYHYRYFWPWSGTNEDPVTGGVQTFLAKYWSEKLGKTYMHAFQSSARTGNMNVELAGEKVLITGDAVIVLNGTLNIQLSDNQ